MHRTNWDDLRFVLAVADSGSVASAARQLGVNHTTVLRRIQTFEEANKIRLFERLPAGYVPTAEGEQMVAAARKVDETVGALERRMAGQDLKLEGVIRLTSTESLMNAVLYRHLATFRQQHPRIAIELALSSDRLSLTKRDADVAIRASGQIPDPLIGERIADVGVAIYGSRTYLDNHSEDPLAPGHAWLGVDEMLMNSAAAHWLRRHVADEQVVLRADSFVALSLAAKAHMGLAVLPCCLGDGAPDLVRLDLKVDNQGMGIWIITHKDLIPAARIRAFVSHMTVALTADRHLIAGADMADVEDVEKVEIAAP